MGGFLRDKESGQSGGAVVSVKDDKDDKGGAVVVTAVLYVF